MADIGVYQIELNGKKYVGSTIVSFRRRWNLHLCTLRKGTHHNPYLQNAYNKYGEKELKFSILEIVETPEECILVEQIYLNKLKPDYNVLIKAGSRLGSKMLEETRIKMIGHFVSDETKEKIRISNTGKKASVETKRKIGEASKGNKYWVGRKHTEESKQKMSEALRGRVAWNKGIPQTDDNKKKTSEACKGNKNHLGHKHTEEIKQKLRDANIGKTAANETRRKMSETQKYRWERRRDAATAARLSASTN